MNGEHFDPEIETLLTLTEPHAPPPDVDAAWGRFRIRRAAHRGSAAPGWGQRPPAGREPKRGAGRSRAGARASYGPVMRLRPEWVAVCALLGLVGAFGFSSTARSATVHVLSLFRATRIAAVPILPSATAPLANRTLAARLAHALSSEVTVTLNEPNRPGVGPAQASQWAGFPAVYASAWQGHHPRFQLRGAHQFNLTLNPTQLQPILDQAGVTTPTLPPSLAGATISIHLARSLAVMYGDCADWAAHAARGVFTPPPSLPGCTVVGEAPSPAVRMPARLAATDDMRDLVAVGLQLLGMSPAAARQTTQTVDWSSTLLIPFPKGLAQSRQVSIHGAQGILLTTQHPHPSYVLLWSQNGMIYSIAGAGSGNQGLALAQHLKP